MRLGTAGLLASAFLVRFASADADIAPESRSKLDQAAIAREEGRLEDAVAGYRAVLESDPRLWEAHAGLCDALRALRDPAAAKEFYAKLVAANPDVADIQVFQAAALPPQEGRPLLAAIVSKHPESVRAHVELGRAHLLGGDLKEAERVLKDAAKKDPSSTVARLLLGDVQFRDGKYVNARKVYEEILVAEPGSVPALLRSALCWHRQDKTDKAMEILGRVVADDNLPRLVAAHWLAAIIQSETGDFAKALAALDRVLAVDRDDFQALLARGQIQLRAGQPAEAAKTFTKASEARPNAPLALFCLAWAHEKSADAPQLNDAQRKERLTAAAQAYEACTRVDPGIRPRDSLGFVYLMSGKQEDGVTQLKRAKDIDPGFAPALNNLGLADDMADSRPEAMKRYEAVISRIDKENVRARVMLALDLWLQGATPRAVKELEAALKIRPDDDLAWTFLGDIHYDQKKVSDAIRDYKKATELNDKNFTAWYHMGLAYEDDKGNDEEADRCYTKAFEANLKPPAEMILRLAELNDEDILSRLDKALMYYEKYRELGGTAEWVPDRIEYLKEKLGKK
ncbi:MAG: tetratricopeptide repeat protein [Planctomycetota bacterium]